MMQYLRKSGEILQKLNGLKEHFHYVFVACEPEIVFRLSDYFVQLYAERGPDDLPLGFLCHFGFGKKIVSVVAVDKATMTWEEVRQMAAVVMDDGDSALGEDEDRTMVLAFATNLADGVLCQEVHRGIVLGNLCDIGETN